MAKAGSFDLTISPLSWFDESFTPAGRFASDLISQDTARVEVSWLSITSNSTRRALILRSSALAQILDSEIGTSLKPIVLLAGVLKQRATVEGIPVVMGADGNLRTLESGETLLL